MSLPDPHLLEPGAAVELDALPTSAAGLGIGKGEAKAEFRELRDELVELQERWYAEGRRKLLIVLQAMDAGGKDGTIRRLFKGVNPQGVRVSSFKVPSRAELDRDFLWRIHREVPARGMIGVFNRSHYEDVLVVRVDQLVPEEDWRRRYALINEFEALLEATGTTVLKFYLHLSPGEQARRLARRLERPDKHWKFEAGDLRKRRQWSAYMEAYAEALARCGTPHAPWRAIPADDKWFRDLAIARVVVGTLRRLDPRYPEADLDPGALEIPDAG